MLSEEGLLGAKSARRQTQKVEGDIPTMHYLDNYSPASNKSKLIKGFGSST